MIRKGGESFQWVDQRGVCRLIRQNVITYSILICHCYAFTSLCGKYQGKQLFSNVKVLKQQKLFQSKKNNLEDVSLERDVSSLECWSSEMGIKMADGVSLSSGFGENDWGFQTTDTFEGRPGESILSVPRSLIMSSQNTLDDLGGMDVFHPAFDILAEEGVEEYRSQFLLMVKVLYETAQNDSSIWYPWLQSLPKDFTTGTYMDDFERQFLSPISLALTEFEDKKLMAFRKALCAIRSKINGLGSFLENESVVMNSDQNDCIKWAFNVVFSRCWIYSDTQQGMDADANIVPLGDMFNHREPANVVVSDDVEKNTDCVEFQLLNNLDDGTTHHHQQQLFLSYGLNNPHRFLVIFGFVDESMPEIFSQIVFTNPCPELVELGCEDRSKMVYRTEDGLISNAVWDCILFALLHSKPDEQKLLYDAHVNGNKEGKTKLHAKYALEVLISLRRHISDTRFHFESKLSSSGSVNQMVLAEHPRLETILRMNKFVSSVLGKVLFRVERMIESEVALRRKQINN